VTLLPGTIVDRYTVEAVLGAGGIAVVYRVRHNTLDSLHALKVLTITSAAIRQRLIQEGRVQASLRHPNILAVTDIVEVDGAPGLIMEYVEGPTLELLLQRERLTFDRAEKLGLGIIAGVSEAHARGLIHRDLKPANVLLAMAGASYVPKVADFGLVKLLTEGGLGLSSTRTGLTMGTPRYMAPEQIRDAKNVDQRADIFSLGAVLYELVTGQQAFPGDDVIDLFNSIATGNFIRPKKLVPTLPSAVEEAIVGALEVDRDERIPDCQTLLSTWTGGDQSDSRVFIRPNRVGTPVRELAVEPAEPKIRPGGWNKAADPASLPGAASTSPERPRRSAPAIERPAIKVVTLPTEGGAPAPLTPAAPVVPPPPMVPPPQIPSAFSLPPTPSLVGGLRGFPSPIREAPIRDSAPRPLELRGAPATAAEVQAPPELRPAPILPEGRTPAEPPTPTIAPPTAASIPAPTSPASSPAALLDAPNAEASSERPAASEGSLGAPTPPAPAVAAGVALPDPSTGAALEPFADKARVLDRPTLPPVEDPPTEAKPTEAMPTGAPPAPSETPAAPDEGLTGGASLASEALFAAEASTGATADPNPAPAGASAEPSPPPPGPSPTPTAPPPALARPKAPVELAVEPTADDAELDALAARFEGKEQGSGKAWALVGVGGLALLAALALVGVGVFWFWSSRGTEAEVAASTEPTEPTEAPKSTTERTEAVAASGVTPPQPADATAVDAAPVEATTVEATPPASASAPVEPVQAPPTKAEPTKAEPTKTSAAKTETSKTDTSKTDAAKKDATKKKESAAKVSVQGEVANVIFRGAKGSFHAGDVPPGDYEIKADFGTGTLESAGQINLKSGQVVTVKCSSRLLVCR
jgi:serine/threonine protein kinase